MMEQPYKTKIVQALAELWAEHEDGIKEALQNVGMPWKLMVRTAMDLNLINIWGWLEKLDNDAKSLEVFETIIRRLAEAFTTQAEADKINGTEKSPDNLGN